MKTFGEVKVGDKLYSLNYHEWGVLTEHLVTNVIRNDIRTLITLKGYLKHQIIGDPNGPKADLKVNEFNGRTMGEVAPSIEGVKKWWIRECKNRIDSIQQEIDELQVCLQHAQSDLNKIQNIQDKV